MATDALSAQNWVAARRFFLAHKVSQTVRRCSIAASHPLFSLLPFSPFRLGDDLAFTVKQLGCLLSQQDPPNAFPYVHPIFLSIVLSSWAPGVTSLPPPLFDTSRVKSLSFLALGHLYHLLILLDSCRVSGELLFYGSLIAAGEKSCCLVRFLTESTLRRRMFWPGILKWSGARTSAAAAFLLVKA